MTTECNQFVFGFHPQKRREIRAQFDGGAITSDGGGLLLREVEKRVGILRQFAACFTDYRNADLIEHQVEERVYGLALGYEDLNDHEELRNDPLLAVLVEKSDPRNPVLAGKSTLNRLELTKETARRKERYKKIVLDHGAVDHLLGGGFPASPPRGAKRNHLGPGRHGRSAAWGTGRAFLPWLLRTLLLPTVVHFSAGSSCCVRGCDHRTSTRRREALRS